MAYLFFLKQMLIALQSREYDPIRKHLPFLEQASSSSNGHRQAHSPAPGISGGKSDSVATSIVSKKHFVKENGARDIVAERLTDFLSYVGDNQFLFSSFLRGNSRYY